MDSTPPPIPQPPLPPPPAAIETEASALARQRKVAQGRRFDRSRLVIDTATNAGTGTGLQIPT